MPRLQNGFWSVIRSEDRMNTACSNGKIVVDQCVDRTIRAKNHIPVSGIESTGIEIGHHIIAANKYMRIAVRIEYQIVSIGLSERDNRHLSLPSKHKFNVTGH